MPTDIIKLKYTSKYLNSQVDCAGRVIASFPTNNGFWLKIADRKNYTIFVYSPQYNFRVGEQARGMGVLRDHPMRFVAATRVLRRGAMPLQQPVLTTSKGVSPKQAVVKHSEQQNGPKGGFLEQIGPKVWLLLMIVISLAVGFFVYPFLQGLV